MDVNDIAEEVNEPKAPLRRMHKQAVHHRRGRAHRRGDGYQEECRSQEVGQAEQGVLHRQGTSRRVREDLKNRKEQLEETIYTFCRLIR